MQNDKKLILIVDDNPENIKMLGSLLIKNGYEIGVSTGGHKALEFIKNELFDSLKQAGVTKSKTTH